MSLFQEEITGCFDCEVMAQRPVEQASCSRGISQVVFIFDTISKRSEMITTNGRVNNPFAAKGTCPNARKLDPHTAASSRLWADGSITALRDAVGGRVQKIVPSLVKGSGRRAPNLDPFGNLLVLRPKSSLLS